MELKHLHFHIRVLLTSYKKCWKTVKATECFDYWWHSSCEIKLMVENRFFPPAGQSSLPSLQTLSVRKLNGDWQLGEIRMTPPTLFRKWRFYCTGCQQWQSEVLMVIASFIKMHHLGYEKHVVLWIVCYNIQLIWIYWPPCCRDTLKMIVILTVKNVVNRLTIHLFLRWKTVLNIMGHFM